MQKNLKNRKLLSGARSAGNVPPLPLIISDHLKRERKPVNDTEFAFYLAGLIQGCGTWGVAPGITAGLRGLGIPNPPNSPRFLILKFHSLDIGLVYYLKTQIGYGQVKILPTYKEIHYIIKEPKGLSKVYDWIEGKMRNGPGALWVPAAGNYWLTGYLDGAAHPEGVNLHLRTWIGGGPETPLEGAFRAGGTPAPTARGLRRAEGAPTPINPGRPSRTGARPTETLFELNLKFAPLSTGDQPGGGFAAAGARPLSAGAARAGLDGRAEGAPDLLTLIWNGGAGPNLYNQPHAPRARARGRLKVAFPDISIRRILWQLDKYPLISSKFIKYLKFRKIYRICQRKEHLTKTGLIKILSLWRLH
jgi:hypothetical protein